MKTVLVVDDESSIRNFVSFVLTKQGYRVSSAEDGRETLEKFAAERPNLTITDVTMPEMEGMEFILALRKKDQHASVIVMSGNSIGKSFLRSARIIGARASLIKPFTAEELRQVVERVLKDGSIS